uniref:P-type Ca(2+) transporter n=2 Tax=Diphyllobothriidae TaxID=28843 RepID=A0A0X3P1J1_SCHSO
MLAHIKAHHAAYKTPDDILRALAVDVRNGLSSSEAQRRQIQLGPNEFKSDPPDPLWKKYLRQFIEPMIGLLLASAGVSVLLGQFDDAISISMAILIVVTVGFIQGYRSEKAVESLKKLMPPKCNCMRDGTLRHILAQDLVPGDIVYLSIGDRVPADLRLIEATDVRIDESNLTGETKAVTKSSHVITSARLSDSSLSDREDSNSKLFDVFVNRIEDRPPAISNDETTITFADEPSQSSYNQARGAHLLSNIGFMGTLVRSGNAIGVVIATGENSEFGEVVRMMQSEEAPRTPLQKSMDRLGKHLSIISIAIIVCIVLIGLIQGRHFLELVTIGVSLAVAAIPEGLPIVVTVTLAIGQMRMASRNAIIKKLPAVETLGCVNVICADKTGTMTKNEMTVTRVVTSALERADVTGVGYLPVGQVLLEDTSKSSMLDGAMRGGPPRTAPPLLCEAADHPNIRRIAEIACLCNNASLKDGVLCGQPTEGALLCLGAKLHLLDPRVDNVRVKEWPFSSESKVMIVKVPSPKLHDPCGSTFFAKGAPDQLIKRCAYYRSASTPDGRRQLGQVEALTEAMTNTLLAEAEKMGSTGLRVLALAEGERSAEDLIFAGLVGLMDPPRSDVEQAIQTCFISGVRVIMITGDSKETACAIGARLSLYRPGDLCLSGDEVESMDLNQLQARMHSVTVFYRTGPRHKCKIVKALQKRGLTVAMTGDGVNDAVALKSADIGIAMGKSGTDVCKEAADVVLVDDDFSSILSAMEEGKALFQNICNFVRFQLSTSIAALSLVAVSTILSLPSPLNAMQILYINILMDGPPAQSLGVEPPDKEVVNQPPRRVQDPILDRRLLTNVLISALTIVSGTLFIFYRELADNKVTPRDTTMTFTCFVLFDMFNALSCRSQKKSIFSIGFLSNRVFLISVGLSLFGQVLVIYFPPLQTVFQTEPIHLIDWLLLLSISSSVFVISEVRKSKLTPTRIRSFLFGLPRGLRSPAFLSRSSTHLNHRSNSGRRLVDNFV